MSQKPRHKHANRLPTISLTLTLLETFGSQLVMTRKVITGHRAHPM